MTTDGLWYLIQWLHYLALAVWTGGIAFLSAVAAPAVHQTALSRAAAGDLVGKMLKRFNAVEILCGLLLLFTTISSQRFVPARERGVGYLICAVLLMGVLTVFYAFHLTPRMESLKEKIPTRDTPARTHAAKMEFDRLHRLYVQLMSLNLVLGLAVLYGSVVVMR